MTRSGFRYAAAVARHQKNATSGFLGGKLEFIVDAALAIHSASFKIRFMNADDHQKTRGATRDGCARCVVIERTKQYGAWSDENKIPGSELAGREKRNEQ
jgi:hypothetical protein